MTTVHVLSACLLESLAHIRSWRARAGRAFVGEAKALASATVDCPKFMALAKGLAVGFGIGFVGITLFVRLTSPMSQQQIVTIVQTTAGQRPCANDQQPPSLSTTITSPPPPPPPPPPPSASPSPPAAAVPSHASVAMCVGGMLSLDVVMRGRSVRIGVLEPLRPDVFVAGTLNATQAEARDGGAAWQRRVAGALDRIGELAPFAAVSVAPQPSPAELLDALRRSGHLPAWEKTVSGSGAGRLRPEDNDPRLWLPTMLSPALGNPQANTLREFHYQSRCMDMIEAAERGPTRGGREYARVLFTRLENHWLHPHPPLALLSPERVWVPAGEDNGGVNDRHWLVRALCAPSRAAAGLPTPPAPPFSSPCRWPPPSWPPPCLLAPDGSSRARC